MNQTKVCTKCNVEKELPEFSKKNSGKYGVSAECKICKAKRVKQWYENNKEKILERQKQYNQDNKDCKIEYDKQRYQKNKELIAESNKQYFLKNKNTIAQRKKQYNQKNKKLIIERRKQYVQTPQGKAIIKAMHHKRRAQKLNAGGSYTGKQILELFDLQSEKCVYCKCTLHKTKRNSFHIDHIVPLSKSGTNDISNIQLLCPQCNMEKHNKLPEDFAQQFGMLI